MSTGAERICEVLEELGIRTVFGLPGTQNVPLFEGLRKSRLRIILATDERAAVMMAGGYYRASGQVAGVFTIPGPGFAYALAGLAEAKHDSAALLHITGTPAESPGSRYQLQHLDQVAMATPVVKRCFRIDLLEQIDGILHEAYTCAEAGEPGPVLVEVSPAVLTATPPIRSAIPPRPREPARASGEQLSRLVARLAASRRPLILAGQGSAGAPDRLRSLVERLGAPVLMTLSGRGVLSDDHPLGLGLDLGSAVEVANAMIAEADLVLALGCKFSHNATGGFRLRLPERLLVHVDASAEVLGANYPASLAIEADVPAVLESLLELLPHPSVADRPAAWDLAAWRERLLALGPEGGTEPTVLEAGGATPAAFFERLRDALPRDAILSTDSGRHQALARRHFRVLSPRGFLAPSDFQSMGFGLPAAIGAALAQPGRPVAALIGDGGLAMSGLELATAVRERLSLLVIVFNDGQLGLIREQQVRDYGRSHAVTLGGLDVAGLAAATGADFLAYGRPGTPTLGAVVGNGRVTVVEVLVADSVAGALDHAKGYVRARARGMLSERLRAWLKRFFNGREFAR